MRLDYEYQCQIDDISKNHDEAICYHVGKNIVAEVSMGQYIATFHIEIALTAPNM